MGASPQVPIPAATISGATSRPPVAILVTSPASPVAPSAASMLASVPPSASSMSLAPGAGCGPSAPLDTATTSASASIRWGEASVMLKVVLTASMLVPAGQVDARAFVHAAVVRWPPRPPVCARRGAGRTPGWMRSALRVADDGIRRRRLTRLRGGRQVEDGEIGVAEIEHGHQVADRGPDLRHVGTGRRVRQVVLAHHRQR